MASQASVRLAYEPLRTRDWSTISGNFEPVGTPFQNPLIQYIVTNDTNVPIVISFDGINSHLYLAANSAFINDISSNKNVIGGILELPAEKRCFVKAFDTGPANGTVSFSAAYITDV